MGALDRASVASEDRLFRSITNVPDAGGAGTRGSQQALTVRAEIQISQRFVMFKYVNSMSVLKRPNPSCVVQRAGCNEQAIRTEDGTGNAIPMPHKSSHLSPIGPPEMHNIVVGCGQNKPTIWAKDSIRQSGARFQGDRLAAAIIAPQLGHARERCGCNELSIGAELNLQECPGVKFEPLELAPAFDLPYQNLAAGRRGGEAAAIRTECGVLKLFMCETTAFRDWR